MIFLHYEWGHRFDIVIKRSKVILKTSSEQTWLTLSLKCYIERYSLKVFLFLEKKNFKCVCVHACVRACVLLFNIYGHGGHLFQQC